MTKGKVLGPPTTHDIIRLDAWRSVFERSNRILTGERVTVQIVPDEEVPHGMDEVAAWSDGADIKFNGQMVREMLRANDKLGAVLRLKGLNYHELCHVLYTPRHNDELVKKVVNMAETSGDPTWWYAFNALEDQRIETWFTANYGVARRYFEATVLEWIIKNGTAESAVLIHGRKYLDPKIRVKAAKVFKKKHGEDLLNEFKTVIDDYLTVVLPTDSIRAYRLIEQYRDLLLKVQSTSGGLPVLIIMDNGATSPQNPHSCGATVKVGRVKVKQARADRDKATEMIEDAIDADIDAEAELEAQAGKAGQGGTKVEADEVDFEGTPQGAGQADGDGDSPDSSGDGSGKGDGESQQSEGSGIGTSGTADHTTTPGDTSGDTSGDSSLKDDLDDFVDEAYDGMDDVLGDEDLQEDAAAALDAVRAAVNNGRMNAAGANARTGHFPPDDHTLLAVRKVHDTLLRIRQEAEPETLRQQVQGRLDPRRYIVRKRHETDIFKSWEPGAEEEVGVEAVILCDVSGSMMGDTLRNASKSLWALKRAFDKLDIRTTILMFDTQHTVLYQPHEMARGDQIPDLRPGGGTDPTTALEQAQRILMKSQASNKVLITITDGGWGGREHDYTRRMKSMHKVGIVTMLLGLDEAVDSYGKHGHAIGHDLDSILQLPKVALKLVVEIMRRRV